MARWPASRPAEIDGNLLRGRPLSRGQRRRCHAHLRVGPYSKGGWPDKASRAISSELYRAHKDFDTTFGLHASCIGAQVKLCAKEDACSPKVVSNSLCTQCQARC